MRIALITGASSGMGEEFALRIDREERDIDEIWLIARRRDRLEQVAAELSHPARIIPMDLCGEKSIDEFSGILSEADVQVGILVSCAGFAKIGSYETVSRADCDRMIDLNCKAAVDITLAAIPYMRAGDRILELCSVASFLPLAHLNLYAAGKSFLLSFTRALRLELLPRGIRVTAVCPWWVGDTEFLKVAHDNKANADAQRDIRHFPAPSKKEDVVRRSLRGSRRGRAVVTPGVISTVIRFFSRLVPTTTVQYLWELLRRV